MTQPQPRRPAQSIARLALAVYWPSLFIATHWPRLQIEVHAPAGSPVVPDKLLHYLAAVMLLALLAAAWPIASRRPPAHEHQKQPARLPSTRAVLVAFTITTVYLGLDEWTQTFVDREFSWEDIVAGLIGASACAAALMLLHARRTLLAAAALGLPMLGVIVAMPGFSPLTRAPVFVAVFIGLTLVAVFRAAARAARRVALDPQARDTPIAAGEAAESDRHSATAASGSAAANPPPRTQRRGLVRSSGFVGHAILVAAWTLLSRLTGLVRDAVIGAVYGLSGVGDAFVIAFMIPNLFRRLFGEGALTAAFIPTYAARLRDRPDLARKLASLVFAMLLIVTGALTLLGEAILFALPRESFLPSNRLAVELSMITLPYMPMICAAAVAGGVLQVHEKFGPPAFAPVLLNLVMILAAAVFLTPWASHVPPQQSVRALALAVVCAGALQLAWQLAPLVRLQPLTRRVADAWPDLRRIASLMLPMVMGLAVFQINTLTDLLIAKGFAADPQGPHTPRIELFGQSLAYPLQSGAAIALSFAQRLYQFPLGVFGIALATAIFPALARHAAGRPAPATRQPHTRNAQVPADARPEPDAFSRTFHQGLRLSFFIGLPASVGLILVRGPLARMIFEHGQLAAADADRIAHILLGYAAGVWAYSFTHVLTRAFYALRDAKTPLIVSVGMVFVNLLLNLTLIWRLGAAGLAWSTAFCAATQVLVLLSVIGLRDVSPISADVLRGWARAGAATIAMTGAVLASRTLTPDAWRALDPVALGLDVSVGALAYAAMAWTLRCDELHWLRRRRADG